MTGGLVQFVGCGPGAADLLTLRAARAIAEADAIVWSASLLEADVVREHARSDAAIVAWPPATERDILDLYARAADDGLRVVRLKGGDPTLFGALEPELSAVRAGGLSWEIVPGVSAVSAAAAALGWELARTGAPLLLTAAGDLAGAMPGGTGVAVFGAGRGPAELEHVLLERGLGHATACAVAVDVSRGGEIVAACELGALEETLADFGRAALTLVIVAAPGALAGPSST